MGKSAKDRRRKHKKQVREKMEHDQVFSLKLLTFS